jgi:hypothetical protein
MNKQITLTNETIEKLKNLIEEIDGEESEDILEVDADIFIENSDEIIAILKSVLY